jgi:hypothetical protein
MYGKQHHHIKIARQKKVTKVHEENACTAFQIIQWVPRQEVCRYILAAGDGVIDHARSVREGGADVKAYLK